MINRWRNNAIEGGYGSYIFIRNVNKDKVWTATWEPFNQEPDGYKVSFCQSKAQFIRVDGEIETIMEVFVSQEDDVEIRRIIIENHGKDSVTLELTSYLEVVLTNEEADMAHRAFSNLFVRTDYLDEYKSLIAVRKPREGKGQEWWAFHSCLADESAMGHVEYETSRGNFIGRGRNISNPMALYQPLSNTVGVVLDPMMSIRRVVKVQPGEQREVSFITGCGGSKEEIREMAVKYTQASSIDRAYSLAITRSQVERDYLNLSTKDIVGFEKIISHLIYGSPTRVRIKDYIIRNKKGQSALWPFGISGDLPIMTLSISDERDIPIAKEVIKAHEFLRMKGLNVDLVILNVDESNYLQPLRTAITNLVERSNGRFLLGKPGGIFIINAANISQEDKALLLSASTLIFKAEAGSIAKQLEEITVQKEQRKYMKSANIFKNCELPAVENSLIFNGYGGFSDDGSEYIMSLNKDLNTPLPWVNVVANQALDS